MIMAEASEASQDELQQQSEAHLRWLLMMNNVAFNELRDRRESDLQRKETDSVDVEVTHEFISSLVNRMAA